MQSCSVKQLRQLFIFSGRALFRLLEWRYHSVPWPSVTAPTSQLLTHIVRRINEASGSYQMFSVLADVVILNRWVIIEARKRFFSFSETNVFPWLFLRIWYYNYSCFTYYVHMYKLVWWSELDPITILLWSDPTWLKNKY